MGQSKRARRVKRAPRAALREPLRSRIVCACGEREVAPKEFADREGLNLGDVTYHFQGLERDGFIRVSRREMVRGLRRNYYVATRRALVTDGEFAEMTVAEQGTWSETTLLCFLRRCASAWRAGTIEARDSSHMSWLALLLDERGFRELSGGLGVALDFQQEIQARSLVRMRRTHVSPISTTAALMGFESPPDYAPPRDSARILIIDEEFARMGSAEKRLCLAATLIGLLRRCGNGISSGTLDARSDSHLSWSSLLLDETGFRELTAGWALMLSFAQEVQQKSLARLASGGERPMPTTVGFVAFESPAENGPRKCAEG